MNRRRIESFVLRLVVEDQENPKLETCHGRIQHVGSRYERQFDQLQDVVTFIREYLAANNVAGDNLG